MTLFSKMKFLFFSIFFLFSVSGLHAASPIITSTALTTATQDVDYIYGLYASDADGDTLSFSVTSGTTLPSWLSLDDNVTQVTTFAGDGSFGVTDATGTAASFGTPRGIVVDSSDNIYVADTGNNRIRKITPAGEVTTFAGSSFIGSVNGTGTAARFKTPTGLAVDSNDNVYVADYNNHLIRKITPSGVVTTFAGSGSAGSVDATGTAASFNKPIRVAVDSNDNVYVADYNNHLIRKITPAGVVTTLAGTVGISGATNATGTSASFNAPVGIAVDSSDNVYVADSGNHLIRKITPAGVVTTFAGTSSTFSSPYGVAVDSSDNVYVSDIGDNVISKLTPSGEVTTLAGSDGSFSEPYSVAVDSNDDLFVADRLHNIIRKVANVTALNGTPTNADVGVHDINLTVSDTNGGTDTQNFTITVANVNDAPTITSTALTTATQDTAYLYTLAGSDIDGDALAFSITDGTTLPAWLSLDLNNTGEVTTFAGTAGVSGSVNASGTDASFKKPRGVAVDSNNNIYVADYANQLIRKITSAGEVTTFAGTAGVTGSADGTGTAASFNGPSGVAVDSNDNVYVADVTNNLIRKITPAGLVSTFAGTGSAGSANGTGTAASFNNPLGVAVDSNDNVYVADADNHIIRKITPAGLVSTYAGSGDIGATNGTRTVATFSSPFAVAIDSSDNIYVVDQYYNQIRKITSAGDVTTLAGSGSVGSADGTGTNASFNFPSGVAVDSNDNVYVADRKNHLIRKITSAGVVTTLAGTAGVADSADGLKTAASFKQPIGIAVDKSGNLYIGDTNNHLIRKILGSSILRGTPTNADVGTYDINLSVSDSNGGTNTQNFTITVENVNDAPTITSTAVTAATQDVDYLYSLIGSDIDGNTLTFSATSGTTFPSWLIFSNKNEVTTFAGSGSVGSSDATGTAASFNNPFGVAVDSTNNIYVADFDNNLIRKITPAGEVTTFAGSGTEDFVDATGTAASFRKPFGISVDSSDNIFVVDSSNFSIRKITPAGVVTTFAGSRTIGSADGTGTAASFNYPYGIAVDSSDNLYIADTSNSLIRKITPAGVVTTFAGTSSQGTADGTTTTASFNHPYGLAIDSSDNIYVADKENQLIRKIASSTALSGTPINTDVGVYDINLTVSDGYGGEATQNFQITVANVNDAPTDLSLSNSSITENNSTGVTIGTFTTTDVDIGETFTYSFCGGIDDASFTISSDTLQSNAVFDYETKASHSVCVRTTDSSSASFDKNITISIIYVNEIPTITSTAITTSTQDIAYLYSLEGSDTNGNTLTFSATSGTTLPSWLSLESVTRVSTFAGMLGVKGATDATGTSASFNNPFGVAVDSNDNVYVADGDNNLIRKITPAGVVTTFAGSGSSGSADGTGTAASFNFPTGVALDSSDNLYVADFANNLIRKITPAGVVTTLAGTVGVSGSADGTGTAASFGGPTGIAVDSNGTIYVTDYNTHLIRKVTSAGVVTTLAGSGSSGAVDGTGTAASFNFPFGIAVDSSDNIFVADSGNNVIRKITPSGIVTTFAGNGDPTSVDGAGTAASFKDPYGIAIDSSDNIYIADLSNSLIRKITPAGEVTTFAGTVILVGHYFTGATGSQNGVASAATFQSPSGLAVDSSDNIYVADRDNQLIRKIATTAELSGTPTNADVGVYDINLTLSDGYGGEATQNFQITVANVNDAPTITSTAVTTATQDVDYLYSLIDSDADGDNLTYSATSGTTLPSWLSLSLSNAGKVTTFAGNGSGDSTDATGTAASFNYLSGVAVDSNDNVYVADSDNNLIRKITPIGVVTTFAGTGSSGLADGTGTTASFNFPTGVAVDSSDNIYVADKDNNLIRKITPAGVVTTFAGSGSAGSIDGTGTSASFNNPFGVAVDSSDNIYVADSDNNLIRKITPAGVVTTFAGSGNRGSADGTGTAASFYSPSGIAVDSSDNLYIADSDNHLIRKITPAGIVTTFAGTAGVAGSTDATTTAASFSNPVGIAVDSSDNLYIADSDNHLIRKITPAGTVTTFAGTKGVSGSANGISTAASFNKPYGLAVDSNDNIYVADRNNNRIRKIVNITELSGTPSNAEVGVYDINLTVSDGNGATDTQNFQITVADVNDAPTITSTAVTIATQDVDYLYSLIGSDIDGNALTFSATSGTTLPSWLSLDVAEVTTFAGGTQGSTNGIGTAASFWNPYGMAVDSSDNIYVADSSNHLIRKITPAGVVTTFAGSAGVSGFVDGIGINATFDTPYSVAVDSNDNIYVAEFGNHIIRKITPAGEVTTFAGTAGVQGSDNGTGAAALFSRPSGIAVDSNDNIYVADTSNHKIRKITPAGEVTTFAGSGSRGSLDGAATAASFKYPFDVAVDSNDNVYVADTNNNIIRKITQAGVVSTFATSFNGPKSVAVDSNDNVYVADTNNKVIRKITPQGVVTILAGTVGVSGSTDGTGTSATFKSPRGVAIDSSGNIYVGDFSNNRIRKLTEATKLTGTPTNADVGVYDINLTVSDGNGATDTQNFTITVANVDDAPVLDPLVNIDTNEDSADFNVTLNAVDVDGNTITYTATSSNADIATVAIINGQLVVTQVADAFGLVNIEVNASANGQSVLQDFNLSVANVNDAPSIDTVFSDLVVSEDSSSFLVDLNISDIDGDDLNVTVESNNTNILTVTPNWSNYLSQGEYDGVTLDFNLTTVADANGIVRITLTSSDASLSTTKTFDVNVTAANDKPTISNISNVVVYMNTAEKNITLDGADIDGDTLTYTSDFNNSVISSINFNGNVMSIVPAQVAGTTDVNVTLSDTDLNTSIGFTFTTIALEAGDDVTTGPVEQNATTTIVTLNDNLVVSTYDDNNGVVKQSVEVSSSITSASTNLLGAVVELISDGVKITYDDNINGVAEVVATVLGEAIHTLTVGNDVTKATFSSPGTTTVIDENSTGDIEITSTLMTSDSNITVVAHADGSAEHSVKIGEQISTFISSLLGMVTVENINGDIQSTVGSYDDSKGYDIKAVVTTYANGTNAAKFIKVSQTDDTDSSDFIIVSSATNPLPLGTKIQVYELDTVLYIDAELKLDNSFIVQP